MFVLNDLSELQSGTKVWRADASFGGVGVHLVVGFPVETGYGSIAETVEISPLLQWHEGARVTLMNLLRAAARGQVVSFPCSLESELADWDVPAPFAARSQEARRRLGGAPNRFDLEVEAVERSLVGARATVRFGRVPYEVDASRHRDESGTWHTQWRGDLDPDALSWAELRALTQALWGQMGPLT